MRSIHDTIRDSASRYDHALGRVAAKKDMAVAVFEFMRANPNPPDSAVHAFADKAGYETDAVEAEIYRLATKFVQFMSGGRAIDKGLAEKDADPKELAMGVEVEQEHVKDPDVARKVALDHLAEISDYYTRLKKMEAEGEGK